MHLSFNGKMDSTYHITVQSWEVRMATEAYVCTLSAELQEKAKSELNEKPEWRDRDIQALRDLVLAHTGTNPLQYRGERVSCLIFVSGGSTCVKCVFLSGKTHYVSQAKGANFVSLSLTRTQNIVLTPCKDRAIKIHRFERYLPQSAKISCKKGRWGYGFNFLPSIYQKLWPF